MYYAYPGGAQRYYGSALTGYSLNYKSADMDADPVFLPGTVKTIDQAEQPLDFVTCEHSCDTLSGSIVLNNKTHTQHRHKLRFFILKKGLVDRFGALRRVFPI
ncbi:MAG: hypothetical protein C4B59_11375 [Candidatus Methanogaster sp.]|uniref:Uncharacterized protein n=1 Tax=Candidatus Methanogaster sp. TaxID=3386292 RepID=A0AC61L1M7_9EURY|nr:MAG: hypothetical protein C4B59_11375 [ANME-2 cluster archaeon]